MGAPYPRVATILCGYVIIIFAPFLRHFLACLARRAPLHGKLLGSVPMEFIAGLDFTALPAFEDIFFHYGIEKGVNHTSGTVAPTLLLMAR